MVGPLQVPQCNCQCPAGVSAASRTFEVALSGSCWGAAFITGCLAVHLIHSTRLPAVNIALRQLRSLFQRPSAMDQQVQEIIDQKRSEEWLFMTDLANVFMVGPALVAIGLAAYFQPLGSEIGYNAIYLGSALTAPLLWCFMFLQRGVRVHYVDMALVSITVIYAIPPGLCTSLTSYYFTIQSARAAHLLLMQVSSLRYAVPVSILHLAWQLWTIGSAPGLQDSLVQNVTVAVFTTSLNWLANVTATAGRLAMASAFWQAGQKRAIVRAFLSAMGDSFVELRADLTLLEDSPSLAALLQGPVQDVGSRGMCFMDFLMPDETERFERFVRSNTSGLKVAHQISVVLRAHTGTKVSATIYHMGLKKAALGQEAHYLCIVLGSFEEHVPSPPSGHVDFHREGGTMPESALALQYEGMDQAEPAPDAPAQEVAASLHSAGPFQVEGGEPWGGSGDRAKMKIRTWFNWEVIEASDSCRKHLGFKESSLLEFLGRCTQPNLNLRYLELAHCLSVNGHQNPNKIFKKVKVSSPADGLEYTTNIHVEITHLPQRPPEEDSDVEMDVDRIRFDENIRFVEMELTFIPAETEQEPMIEAQETTPGLTSL